MSRRLLMGALALPLLFASPARAEILQLIDNTQVAGKILHFYDGVFAVETAGGQKVDVPRDKIKAITFQLPAPRLEFSSPEKTFNRWRDAVAKGDLRRMVDCYALMYQGLVHAQLGQGEDDFKKLQKDLEGTKFEIKGTHVKGDVAELKVQKSRGEDVLTAEIRLVMENGEWKMTP